MLVFAPKDIQYGYIVINIISNKFVNLNPLYTGNPINHYFYSADPDEILHNAACYQGLHCLLR